MIRTLGFGGGCHWCTEAVFQNLRGVSSVAQGWIAADSPDDAFSEAVLVEFDDSAITPRELLEVHLDTHSSSSDHSMRGKYRSAVYISGAAEEVELTRALADISAKSGQQYITRILAFREFRASRAEIANYYVRGPERPFSRTYIEPKLAAVRERFPHLEARPKS